MIKNNKLQNDIKSNLENLHSNIAAASKAASRKLSEVKILAASKTQTIENINKTIELGQRLFGENRVQEAKLKFENILKHNKQIKLHLTGPLQTNKVKLALELFSVFHTLDREKLVRELIKFPEKLTNKFFLFR